MSFLFHLGSVLVYALVVLAVLSGCLKILMFFRAKDMRALASRWGFQYIGPPALRLLRLWFSSSHEVSPPLPASFPLACYPVEGIRQVWNVIEGRQNGVLVLIFDSYIGGVKGTYYTFIACQTQQNPFGRDTSRNCAIQSDGWTFFYRIPFLQTPWPWTMGIRRLDDYVNKLRVGSVCEPSC